MASLNDAMFGTATPPPQQSGLDAAMFGAPAQSNPLNPNNQSVSTTAPQAKPHTGPSIWQNELRGAKNVGGLLLKGAGSSLGAANAVLGAPQRFVSGFIGSQKPDLLNRIGSAYYEGYHPSQQAQFDVQGERATGLDRLLQSKQHGEFPVTVMMPTGGFQTFMVDIDQAKKFGVDTLYENMTDPLNLLYGAGALKRLGVRVAEAGVARGSQMLANLGHGMTQAADLPARAGGAAFRAIPGAVEGGGNLIGRGLGHVAGAFARDAEHAAQIKQRSGAIGTNLMNWVRTSPHLKRGLETGPARTVESIENSATDYVGQLDQYSKDVLQRNADAINAADAQAAEQREAGLSDVKVVLPDEVRQMNKRLAWVEGTASVRKDAEKDGYVPTDFERRLPVIGTLTRYRPDYIPKVDPAEYADLLGQELIPGELTTPKRVRLSGEPGYSKPQSGVDPEDSTLDRLRKRAEMSMATLGGKQRMLAKAMTLHGVQGTGFAGLGIVDPDIERTQRSLEAAKGQVGSETRVRRLEALLAAQKERAAANMAHRAHQVRHGEEVVPLGETMEGMGQRGQYVSDKLLGEKLWPTALKNVGMTEGKMGKLGMGAPPTVTEKAKDISGLANRLKGLRSTAAGRAMTAQRAQSVAENVSAGMEKLVQAERDLAAQRAARVAQDVGTSSQRSIDKLAKQTEAAGSGIGAKTTGLLQRERNAAISAALESATKTASAGQRGVTRAEHIVGAPVPLAESILPGSASANARRQLLGGETREGRLQASAARTAGEVTEPTTAALTAARQAAQAGNVGKAAGKTVELQQQILDRLNATAAKSIGKTSQKVDEAADSAAVRAAQDMRSVAVLQRQLSKAAKAAKGREAVAIARDQKILSEIQRRVRYNHGLGIARAELDRLVQREANVLVPKAILKHQYADQIIQPGFAAGKAISDLGKNFMFLNPLVHGFKNVGTLQAIGPAGFAAVLRATALAAKLDEASRLQLIERLRGIGALSHFNAPIGEGAGKLAQLGHAARGATESLDHNQRIALLQFLDTSDEMDAMSGKAYKDLPEFEKAALINETLGEYGHMSELAQAMRRWGVPFPNWRLQMVARITKALLTQPNRINFAIREMRDYDRDMFAKDPYELGFYTPIDTGLEGLTGNPNFITGFQGPFEWFNPKDTLGQKVGRAVSNIPPVGLGMQFLGLDPYANKTTRKVPGIDKAAASLLGEYYRKKQP